MATAPIYGTQQEEFWAGDFGDEYIGRNNSPDLLAANLHFFSIALKKARPISSCMGFGANVGMNLRALKLLYPKTEDTVEGGGDQSACRQAAVRVHRRRQRIRGIIF
jgi:hypothetical protein